MSIYLTFDRNQNKVSEQNVLQPSDCLDIQIKMCFPSDLIEKSCGLVVLNECNTFTYYCKVCSRDFECGAELEMHILLGHVDRKLEPSDEHSFDSAQEDLFMEDIKVIDHEAKDENRMKPEIFKEHNEIQGHLVKHEKTINSKANSPIESNFFDENSNDDMGSTDSDRKPVKLEEFEQPVKSVKSVKPKKSTKSNQKKAVQPKQSQMFYCDICPESSFHSKANLRHHMKRHTKNIHLNKRCPVCNKKARKYEHHTKLCHLEEKPFKCDFCDAKYKTNDNRLIHQRSHTGERPYLCSICGSTFTSPSAKYKHQMQVHTKTKRYQCTQCERSFYTPSLLRDHGFSFHSTLRPYVCDICGKAYSTQRYLNKHKKTHGDKMIQCNYCDKKFKLFENKRKHEKQVHKAV